MLYKGKLDDVYSTVFLRNNSLTINTFQSPKFLPNLLHFSVFYPISHIMVVLLLAIIGGIYFACKHAKTKKRVSKYQGSQEHLPAAVASTKYRDSPPGYDIEHQPWCNRTCDGRCKEIVQYTPPETPRDSPIRENFNVVENDGLYHGAMSEKNKQRM